MKKKIEPLDIKFYSKILIVNYFSTKLYISNLVNTLYICQNNFILKKRHTRLVPYFYSNLNFVIKPQIWKFLFTLIFSLLKKYNKKIPEKPNFIKKLTLKSIKKKYNNILYRKIEFLSNL